MCKGPGTEAASASSGQTVWVYSCARESTGGRAGASGSRETWAGGGVGTGKALAHPVCLGRAARDHWGLQSPTKEPCRARLLQSWKDLELLPSNLSLCRVTTETQRVR